MIFNYFLPFLFISILSFDLNSKDIFNQKRANNYFQEDKNLQIFELKLMKNRIFATHGFSFESNFLKKFFYQYEYYRRIKKHKSIKLLKDEEEEINKIETLIREKELGIRKEYKNSRLTVNKKVYFRNKKNVKRLSKSNFEFLNNFIFQRYGINIDIPTPDPINIEYTKKLNTNWIVTKFEEDWNQKSIEFNFYELGYKNNKLVYAADCFLREPPDFNSCNPEIYFDVNSENIRIISGRLNQTTITYEWWYHYWNRKLVLIEFIEFSFRDSVQGYGESFRKSFWIDE